MNEFEISISDDDLMSLDSSEKEKSELLVLGGEDCKNIEKASASQIVEEIMPKLLARKLERIIPNNYKLMQIKLDVKLKGSLLGQEVSGNVQVTFGPKD